MYKVLLGLCQRNLPLLSSYSAVLDTYLEFKTKVEELESLIRQKILIIQGLSEDKLQTRTHLAEFTIMVASSLHAFAAKNKNFDLMEKVSYTVPKIIDARDAIAAHICENIYDLAVKHLSDIAPWGIDVNTLQSLKTAIDLFCEKSPQPTMAVKHRKTLTTAINEKIREIDFCKKHQLDMSVNRLMLTEKVFIRDYQNESRIIDAGIRHKKDILPAPDSEAVA